MDKSNDFLGFLEGIDFPLLRRQKYCLMEVYASLGDAEKKALQGIHNLLDDIQDAADALGLPVFAKSKNDNCLAGIKCPKCGQEDQFSIEMTSMIDVTDDGTDFHNDTEWDGKSFINCHECGHDGRVWEFQA